ncbi:hypothetical protein, partial [Paenibacillus elgii]|uniref:hypothetical protein n=1 Tax=Paenibacillus elgii TaxID=189691 RepID=UPI001CB890F7
MFQQIRDGGVRQRSSEAVLPDHEGTAGFVRAAAVAALAADDAAAAARARARAQRRHRRSGGRLRGRRCGVFAARGG